MISFQIRNRSRPWSVQSSRRTAECSPSKTMVTRCYMVLIIKFWQRKVDKKVLVAGTLEKAATIQVKSIEEQKAQTVVDAAQGSRRPAPANCFPKRKPYMTK